jgi:hypothetical protein
MPQQSSFVINGVVDTSKNVLSNIDALCQASGCWITYDVSIGQWAVIINNTGSSVFSFDNSNIIGNITVSGTGINELYNSVTVQYPLQDLAGDIDFANLTLDPALRFPNENDNNLSLQTNLINNPVQAQFMGQIALKQNRIDKVITLSTDFGAIGLKAGDIIDVTQEMYGYTNKLFRIITIDENDAADGSINLTITALEYDATVYDASGLTYTNATSASGVVPYNSNSNIQGQNAASNTNLVYSFATGQTAVTGVSYTTTDAAFFGLDGSNNGDGAMTFYNLGYSYTLKYTGKYILSYAVNWGSSFNVSSGGVIGVPNNIRKNTFMTVLKNGTRLDVDGSSIIKGDDPNADVILSNKFTGTQGDVIQFYVGAASDLTDASTGAISGAKTTSSSVAVSGNLFFAGNS